MYFHFLKLTALGASQDQIHTIYNNITGANGLDASGFPDITPSAWTQYTGYIFSGGISSGQLGVQNLNSTNIYSMPNPEGPMGNIVTQHADTSFIRDTGYYVNPPSGCCFPAGTQVMLAEGHGSLAIEKIKPGMRVLSPTRNNPHDFSTVKLVSRPRRDGRALYSLLSKPNSVEFTATHPIFLRYAKENGSPVLGFVDVETALKVNPLWGAFQLEALPRNSLKQSIATSPQDDDTLLYDLILDPSEHKAAASDVSTFFVCQSGSNEKVQVCSEAPNVVALPATTRFVLAFVAIMASRPDVAKYFPDGLRSGALDYTARILSHRHQAAAAVMERADALENASMLGKDINLDTALSALGALKADAQPLMDASEAVISAMGLTLQDYLDDGWQFLPSAVADTGSLKTFCLSTHNISLAQNSLMKVAPGLKNTMLRAQRALSQTLMGNPKISISVASSHGEQKTATAAETHKIAYSSIGPNLHRVHSVLEVLDCHESSSLSPWPDMYTLTVTVDDGAAVLSATGQVSQDVSALWPLHVKKLPSVGRVDALAHWHIGWIAVTGAVVSKNALQQVNDWTQSNAQAVTKMDIYAEVLGADVGKDIVQTLFGNSKQNADDEAAE